MKDEEQPIFIASNKSFLDECIRKFNDRERSFAGIMKNEDRPTFVASNEIFLDECVRKINERLEKGDTVTAADISESFGVEQKSAPYFELKPTKPVYKTYEDLAYLSATEVSRCRMLINKLTATIDLLNALEKYYDAISVIERDNELFGFDLTF